jgi:hypothetical protein
MHEYDRLESSRRINVRYLLEEAGESRILACLVEALGKAFSRFGHEGIKVDTVGRDLDESAYDLSFLLDAQVKHMGRVQCRVYLDLEAACRLVRAFAGVETADAEECAALGREFFAVVDRYFRAGLERRGFEVAKRRKPIQAGPASEPGEERGPGMTMGLATPSGPVALRMCIQARG